MSLQSINLDSGGNSFPFDHYGASITGKITTIEEVQQTDVQTGAPAFWQDGQPKMMFRVELKTDLHDDEYDDGLRSVYLRGSRKPETRSTLAAVLTAARAATGSSQVSIGGTLTLTYVEDGPRTNPAFNPPKKYEAKYVPPSTNLGEPEQAPATAAAPAVPAPQAQQQPSGPINPATGVAYTPQQIAAAKAAGIPLG